MKVSTAKENILKRVRNALSQPVQLPFPHAEGSNPVFREGAEGPEIKFAEEFSRLQGKFVFCANHDELAENLEALAGSRQWKSLYCREPQLLKKLEPYHLSFISAVKEGLPDCDAGITGCECLVASTGSVVLSSAQPSGRATGIFPPVHIVVAYINQLVPDIREAVRLLKERYSGRWPSMVSFQSGPSRTADIEKTLVVGVHGPGEVYVFLVDQEA
jgi:L-lactate dehydrogenase complex protein LldG